MTSSRLLSLSLLLLGLAGAFLPACGARAVETPTTTDTLPPLIEVEAVGDALRMEIDRVVASDDQQAIDALAADLRPAVQLLALLRSPRAASLAQELTRLNASDALQEDSWGGRTLLRWTYALHQWELRGTPDTTALEDLQCEAPPRQKPANGTTGSLPPWQSAARHRAPTTTNNDIDGHTTDSDEEATSGDGAYDEPADTQPAESPLARAIADLEHEQAADYQAYGACVLLRIDTAFRTADQALTPLQRASFGALYDGAHQWLRQRALPIDDGELLGANDLRLRSARAWTQLPSADESYNANGIIVALRSTGVSVSYRPAVHGVDVLQASPASASANPSCFWPGIEAFAFAASGRETPQAVLNEGLSALRSHYQQCETLSSAGAHEGARAMIDAGLHWEQVSPVLRQLVAMRRPPTLLVHEAQSGLLSALPVEVVPEVRGTECGVEAHLRRDGVVLRGGGAPVSLLSWSEANAFEQLTRSAKDSVARCEEPPLIRIVVDDPSVDWGIIVRVIERMSWPQSCGDQACLRSALVVGTN